MLFQREHAHIESVQHRMALGTIGRHIVLGEFTLVIILVATVACPELHGVGE